MEPALLGSPPPRLRSCSLGKTLLQTRSHLHEFSLLPPKQLLCPRGCFFLRFSPVSCSSKPSPWIFMFWLKPPSFLQLSAQCLGNLLPNLLATKAKKTLQNTDDQKQCLPFSHMLPGSMLALRTPRRRLPASPAPPALPQVSDGTPPRSRRRLKGL